MILTNKHLHLSLYLFFFFPILFFSYQPLCAQEKSMDEKVDSVLQLMTLDEKVGQMNLYNGFWDITGPAPESGDAKSKYEHLKSGLVGAMLNVKGAQETRQFQELAVNESRLGIPLLFGFDVIHGQKTIFPIPLAESSSWDLEAIEKSARIAAIEASAIGINWTFAPMVDISRDARWGRVMEGAGEDPYLTSLISVARVKGFQGSDLAQPNTIAATAKHFAAYGFIGSGREYNAVDISLSTLYNTVLPPFKACVDADVKSIMNSFSTLNGIPATGDSLLQRNILKGTWGFNGFVVSDWFSVKEMVTHGYANDLAHAGEIAAIAGSDMDMESYAYVNHLANSVRSGLVDEKIIDDAARRILKVKFELGLFDDPYRYCDENREKELLFHEQHKEAALDMAKKSIVLLKNHDRLLPLSTDQKNILVIGELASEKNSPLGNWRLGADNNSAVSVLEGLNVFTDNYTYEQGVNLVNGQTSFAHEININKTDTSGFHDAITKAQHAEVIIMVLGEHGYQSGEGRSRSKLGLPGLQQELLEAVYQVNPNIILVLMNGRPLAIPWAAKHIPSILETWQLGTQSGHAIAQTIFGKNNPSGKLTMCFPRSVGQVPIHYNGFSTGRPGTSDNVVFWTHYIDELNTPLFPFGYGLSYSNFEYSDLKIDATKSDIVIRVQVKNTSVIDGEEIVQLYIRDKVASVVRPVLELKGFKKAFIQAKESVTIEFKLSERELGFFNSRGEYILEPGLFEILVGPSSQSGLKGKFNLSF